LRSEGINATANIIGEGPERGALERQIVRSELSGAVRLLGALSSEKVFELMRDTARTGGLLAFSGRVSREGDSDGLPNVLLEAAASGLPIITAEVGSVRDFVDETTGRLCPPDDPPAFATALRLAWQDAAQTRQFALAARRRVEERHDLRVTGGRLAQVFASLK
jgi:glycosyltransferase involved in cell wall biosynthesis